MGKCACPSVLCIDNFKELGQNDIFPILRLSYMFLPKHLQNCFAFCCILNVDCIGFHSPISRNDLLNYLKHREAYAYYTDVNNLINLRYLELPEKYISLIRGIGRLKFLQELNMFDLKSEMGYRIDELEYLNELCKLGNNCLENAKDAEEAYSVKSCVERQNFTNSRSVDLIENMLDNLQPPECLWNMSIKSTIWMNNCQSDLQSRENRIVRLFAVENSSTF
ncbi:hypothetical protein IEQ34_018563 [Dendrobium chrysotoxum]|uniref:Uncharacterized protein n=1 Tax=Dendrobium chrysotoxum TaxID=161865 RepID=A0AAV7G6E9_DENCH|nr:hypothetical protein IEQ34_018563 [Dendrobium chrysotoxum]